MSDTAAISLAVLGALIAVVLAAGAGWLIGTFCSRMRQAPPRHCGPLFWLAGRSRLFWIVAIAAPALYIASFGPACWISSRVQPDGTVVNAVYPQLVRMMWHRSSLGYESLLWRYVTVGHASGDKYGIDLDPRGQPRISF